MLEPLQGYLMLAERLYESPSHYSGSWNFGPSEESKSVSWITDKITQYWQQKQHWCLDENCDFYESVLLRLDSSKARTMLAWKSQWGIEQAIYKTVEWYQAYANAQKMKDITVSQIKDFTQGDSMQQTKNLITGGVE